jgi:hypothetical protein
VEAAEVARLDGLGDVREALRRWLGADARVVAGLSDEELAELHSALVTARKRQAAALAAASDEAFRQMPAFLRDSFHEFLGR